MALSFTPSQGSRDSQNKAPEVACFEGLHFPQLQGGSLRACYYTTPQPYPTHRLLGPAGNPMLPNQTLWGLTPLPLGF